jgi:hypothetical protein
MGISRERLIKATAAAFDYQRAFFKYVLLIEKAAKEAPNNPGLQDVFAFAIEKLKDNEENFKIVADEIKNHQRIVANKKLRQERRIVNEERRKAKWLAKKNRPLPSLPYHVFQSLFEEEVPSSSTVEKPNGETK